MIKSKKELKFFLECDRIALKKTYKTPRCFHDEIWKYQILMRKCSYLSNVKKGIIKGLLFKFYKFRYIQLGYKLGFSIPYNVIGPGLAIVHYGQITINQNSKIGKNCRIHEGVTIGSNASKPNAPILGDNIYIASGAKIIGDITLANDLVIGANAVVTKSVLESGITLAGVPAKKVSSKNSDNYLIKASDIVTAYSINKNL